MGENGKVDWAQIIVAVVLFGITFTLLYLTK
jgi:hypothetical protein